MYVRKIVCYSITTMLVPVCHTIWVLSKQKNARKNILHLLEFLYYVKTLKIDKQQSMENLSVQKYGDGSSKKWTLALRMNIKETFSNRMEGIAKGKV